MSIPVLIVTGFLGAGKTSFLRHLLPLCGEAGVRPALIINEVGTMDVDGQLLADLHSEQAMLVGGCVCCTLQAQLAETVDDLLTRQAGDLIIIECSGISNPLDVISLLATPALLSRVAVSHVVCLLDAGRIEKLVKAVELARRQSAVADVLLLNKSDRLAEDQRKTVRELADSVNLQAVKYHTAFGDPGREALLGLLHGTPTREWCTCGDTHQHAPGDHHHHHALPSSFCTVALPLPHSLPRHSLEKILHSLPENVIRAKGFAHLSDGGWQVLQKVYDSIDIYPHTGATPSMGGMLICIGEQLDAEILEAVLNCDSSDFSKEEIIALTQSNKSQFKIKEIVTLTQSE